MYKIKHDSAHAWPNKVILMIRVHVWGKELLLYNLLKKKSLIQENAYDPSLLDRSEQCQDHELLVHLIQIDLMITACDTHGAVPPA